VHIVDDFSLLTSSHQLIHLSKCLDVFVKLTEIKSKKTIECDGLEIVSDIWH